MIYFIAARELGRVKIGFSDAPWRRFTKMQSDSPCLLTFERVYEGDRATESAFHSQFHASRIIGEWFAITPDIETWLATIDPMTLAEAGQVTPAYARMLLAGTRRPSLTVALRIYDATGIQLGPLAGLERRSIDVARTMAVAA